MIDLALDICFPSPGQILGNYRLLATLGQGASAQVFLAEDLQLKRQVAIKVLANISTSEEQLHEARILAGLNHKNLVQIYHCFHHQQWLVLVMEYVQGQNLQQKLQQQKLSLVEKLDIVTQIAEGLAFAHQQGVLHSDIKAANILLDENLQVKIADFGIARLLSAKGVIDNSKNIWGTDGAMSPEQIRVEQTDHRSDLFCFGLLAFELFSGRHAFADKSSLDLNGQVLAQQAMNAEDIVPVLPVELCQLLNQLLRKSPADRPQSSDRVRDKLKQTYLYYQNQQLGITQQLKPAPINFWQRYKLWLSLFLLSCFTLGYFLLDKWPAQPVRYLAVLAPVVQGEEHLSAVNAQLTITSIEDGIEQLVLAEPGMRLVATNQWQQADDDLEVISHQSGAHELIQTELDCDSQHCQLTLVRTAKSQEPDSPWVVLARQSLPLNTDSYLDVFANAQMLFAGLYSSDNLMHIPKMQLPEQAYIRYLQFYRAVRKSGHIDDPVLQQLQTFTQQYPGYYPAYALFLQGSILRFEESSQQQYLQNVENWLTRVPADYQQSLYAAVDLFGFYLRTGQLALAENKLQTVIESGRDPGLIAEMQANLYLARQQLDDAVAAYQQALKSRPGTALSYNLALAYWWQGKLEESKSQLQHILAVTPKDSMSVQLLAAIYLLQGQLQQAIDSYLVLLELQADSFSHNNLAIAYMLSGQLDNALKHARLAVDKNPDNPGWHLNLADIYQLQANSALADAHYQQVLLLNAGKQDVKALLDKAQAYAHTQQHMQAVELLQQAQVKSPQSAEVAYAGALIYSLLGERVSAVVQVERALTLGMGTVWFSLPWFNGLCSDSRFLSLFEQAGTICQPVNVSLNPWAPDPYTGILGHINISLVFDNKAKSHG